MPARPTINRNEKPKTVRGTEKKPRQPHALNPAQPQSDRISGIYVDVENLYNNAQPVIKDLITNWPMDKAPPPYFLNLYVVAVQTELWRTWAENEFPKLKVNVLGTQQFSWDASKNSADIALSLTAAIDLTTERINHIVVVSNDSDFLALHTVIRNQRGAPRDTGRTPFLWVITDEEDRISKTIHQFFPKEQTHVIPVNTPTTHPNQNGNHNNYHNGNSNRHGGFRYQNQPRTQSPSPNQAPAPQPAPAYTPSLRTPQTQQPDRAQTLPPTTEPKPTITEILNMDTVNPAAHSDKPNGEPPKNPDQPRANPKQETQPVTETKSKKNPAAPSAEPTKVETTLSTASPPGAKQPQNAAPPQGEPNHTHQNIEATPERTTDHITPDPNTSSKANTCKPKPSAATRWDHTAQTHVTKDDWDQIASTITDKTPVGLFSSRDCKAIIKKYWPNHEILQATPSQIGSQVRTHIWPVLEKLGVTKKKGPRNSQYEMTARAKNKNHEAQRTKKIMEAPYLIPIDLPEPKPPKERD